ncbi:hypothetical protein E3N88_01881 [Mikania micrantha]|uniref:Uncharacterized protein n=1 Tax=Mikania micrantha TaxID=192012 RepID=A0A5N6Q287_9ASTR|nr:hypothetical protein E3N88_01881 [Mikania micrantha]
MSASQLLRILQTLPASPNDQICVFNTNEADANTNTGSTCTNPFLSNEDDNQLDLWNNLPSLETSTFGNESTYDHEDEAFKKFPASCNDHPDSLANTTEFRIDKHSVECTMPELMVCYKDKESDFHVKDICIDEETHDNGTISILNDKDYEFSYDSVGVENDDEMIEANIGNEFLRHEWLRSSTMACCSMDVELNSSVQNATKNYGQDKSTHICDQEKFNLSTNLQACDSMISLHQDWSLTPLDFPAASNVYDDDLNRHPLQDSKDNLSKRANVASATEKQDKYFQSKINESNIEESVTFHFDTGKTDYSSPSEVANTKSVYELSLKVDGFVDQQDMGFGYKVTGNDHETRHAGESSFSMAGVISELISSSRPMPFVGGISTRSDSSATSTRSFAFPA